MLASLAVSLLAGVATASPIANANAIANSHSNVNVARNMADYTSDIEIHSSCNATQRRMLQGALADTYEVIAFAQEYVQKNGPNDPVFQLYFGKEKDAYAKSLGVWNAILTSNKKGALLRCDNIDGNCGQPGWRGHWRGSNATSETVICDLSYTDRLYNEAFCMFGFQLATSPKATYWSIDLLHRMLHVPQITGDVVHHYIAEGAGLSGVLQLAATNSSNSPFDSDAIQYFAAHVYAVEVAKGGNACLGNISAAASAKPSSSSAAASSTSAPAAATSAAPAATSKASSAAAAAVPATSSSSTVRSVSSAAAASSGGTAGADCHTHADGTAHCGSH